MSISQLACNALGLRYFHGCPTNVFGRRRVMYRVYVTDSELVAVKDDSNCSTLHYGDVAELHELGRLDGNFQGAAEDYPAVKLEGPSTWARLFHGFAHEAVLKFTHRQRGTLALALPTEQDLHAAFEWLPSLFGSKFNCCVSELAHAVDR